MVVFLHSRFVFLEDLLQDTSVVSKAGMLLAARLLPASIFERFYMSGADPDALATIIFSSGSTGVLPFFHSFGFTVTLGYRSSSGSARFIIPTPPTRRLSWSHR